MDSSSAANRTHTVIVEHLDPELEDWQALEYKCIAEESSVDNWKFLLSGLSSVSDAKRLLDLPATNLTEQNVESLYPNENERRQVCLLDPKAKHDLSPEDGDKFDVFLFGGILGDDPPRGKSIVRYPDRERLS